MKIAEAIEIVKAMREINPNYHSPDTKAALQLLIEAGKRLEANRRSAWPANLDRLPGETEE